jgi:deoxyribonuclease-4
MFGIHIHKTSPYRAQISAKESQPGEATKTKGGKARCVHSALSADLVEVRQTLSGASSAQIFVTGPQGYARVVQPYEEQEIHDWVLENNIALIIHGSYLDTPWRLSSSKNSTAIQNIKLELDIAKNIAARGVVVHLSNAVTDDDGEISGNFAKILSSILGDSGPPFLYLEVHCSKDSKRTFETPRRLGQLYSAVVSAGYHGRVGLCIDTAHLHACGMTLDSRVAAKAWFDQLERELADAVGQSNEHTAQVSGCVSGVPICLHLNDSASIAGSGKDKHALFGSQIWGRDDSGLRYILEWARKHSIPTILERDVAVVQQDLEFIAKLIEQ